MNAIPNEPSPAGITALIAAAEALTARAAAPAARPSQPVTPEELSGVRTVVLRGRNPAQAAWGAHALSGCCGCEPGVLLADCDLWNDVLAAEDEDKDEEQ
ncbi:hypothetical protein [Kitasatospora kifunensis]|uniref:Uncharacterized protein n=1 Tax=Kitasatospora kifunensis TaxID=58351 RepID=A0A7W7VZU1_KITKI|nr:hypothetical protein [Kitasatospora kifunensis]MBB4929157.1 hypothetical protein [Kitasatospora kifunensis]